MITDEQKRLMNHCIGKPNGESERNWFGTSYGCRDSDEFEKLIKYGLADKCKAPEWSGDDVIYSLTEKGKHVLNND